jgi:hypothetical protein
MRNIAQTKLKFLSFYYFWLIFLVACTGFDFYMDTVTGFTFGYMGAFIYMYVRLRSVQKHLENYDDE